MGRIYTTTFSATAVTRAADLFEITAPADSVIAIHGFDISQTTDVGDAAEELILVTLKSGCTTSGSGGSSLTPVPINFGDAASGATVEGVNTTVASGGTSVTHIATAWNVRAPLNMTFTPEMRPILSPSRLATLTITAPADSLTMNGTLWFEEIGG